MPQTNVAKYIFSTLLCFLLFFLAPDVQGDNNFVPWDFTKPAVQYAAIQSELTIPAWLLRNSVILFSTYISPVDGDRCNMYPTCSAYSRQAVEKHGFLMGLLLTVDRLIHESNEVDSAPQIVKWNRLRYLDPVSNNDYWWQLRD